MPRIRISAPFKVRAMASHALVVQVFKDVL